MQMARMQTYGHGAQQGHKSAVLEGKCGTVSEHRLRNLTPGIWISALSFQMSATWASLLPSFCLSFLIYKKKLIVSNYPYVFYM